MSKPAPVAWNFSTIKVGDEFEWTHDITAKNVEDFCKLSGDTNPLHLDSAYAKELGYKDRVVYGALSVAYISQIVGVHFPGPGTIWLSQNLKFESPVYIGDTLTFRVKVAQKNETLRAVSLSFEATKKGGTQKTMKGEAVVTQAKDGHAPESASGTALTGEALLTVPVSGRLKRTHDAVAIVTGASRGIGAAVAQSLAARGVKVAVNYLSNRDAAEGVVETIRAAGGEAAAIRADLGTPAGARSLFEAATKEFGRVDILVNNASFQIQKKNFIDATTADLDKNFSIFVGSAFELSRLALPGMRERSYGRIINILTSSVLGAPPAGWTPYVVAKSALWGLSKCMAVELAPWGITTNMVSPSFVLTDQLRHLTENQLRAMALRNPSRRLAHPNDIAETVAFLASPEAQHVNGVNVPVSGAENIY